MEMLAFIWGPFCLYIFPTLQRIPPRRQLFPAFSGRYTKGNKENRREGGGGEASLQLRGEGGQLLPQLLSHTNTQGSATSWALPEVCRGYSHCPSQLFQVAPTFLEGAQGQEVTYHPYSPSRVFRVYLDPHMVTSHYCWLCLGQEGHVTLPRRFGL